MTAQIAATTAASVDAPDSTEPRLDPEEACGTLTILVEVTVTTEVTGTGEPVSPAAGEEGTGGATVYVSVTGTEMFEEPLGVGLDWKKASAPNTTAMPRNAPATPSTTMRLRPMCRRNDLRAKLPSGTGDGGVIPDNVRPSGHAVTARRGRPPGRLD
jgi:hypothetical protein